MIKLGIFSGDFNWRKGIFPFFFPFDNGRK
jgi:hypothetical protein